MHRIAFTSRASIDETATKDRTNEWITPAVFRMAMGHTPVQMLLLWDRRLTGARDAALSR
jgi:hypothetical protein